MEGCGEARQLWSRTRHTHALTLSRRHQATYPMAVCCPSNPKHRQHQATVSFELPVANRSFESKRLDVVEATPGNIPHAPLTRPHITRSSAPHPTPARHCGAGPRRSGAGFAREATCRDVWPRSASPVKRLDAHARAAPQAFSESVQPAGPGQGRGRGVGVRPGVEALYEDHRGLLQRPKQAAGLLYSLI